MMREALVVFLLLFTGPACSERSGLGTAFDEGAVDTPASRARHERAEQAVVSYLDAMDYHATPPPASARALQAELDDWWENRNAATSTP